MRSVSTLFPASDTVAKFEKSGDEFIELSSDFQVEEPESPNVVVLWARVFQIPMLKRVIVFIFPEGTG